MSVLKYYSVSFKLLFVFYYIQNQEIIINIQNLLVTYYYLLQFIDFHHELFFND